MTKIAIMLAAASGLAITALPAPVSAQPASPLAQYKGFGHNERADEAQFKREQQARKNQVAQCMRDAGFKYVPKPEVDNPQRTRGAGLPDTFKDPNADYVAGLDDGRKREYNMTLYGVPDPNDPENLWDPRSATGGGCWGDAMRTYPGVYAARSALAEKYAEMQMAALEKPEFKQAEASFAACMTEKGFAVDAESRTISPGEGMEDSPSQKGVTMRALADCRNQARLGEARGKVIGDMEADFVRQNKAELDRHAARLAAQPAVN